MHGIFPYMFDCCWADPVVHLLLLMSSMASEVKCVDWVERETNRQDMWGELMERRSCFGRLYIVRYVDGETIE